MSREEGILCENSLYFHPFQLKLQQEFFGIRTEDVCGGFLLLLW